MTSKLVPEQLGESGHGFGLGSSFAVRLLHYKLSIPTGCATSCTSEVKWLQMGLHDISSLGTKWTCCRIARKPRGKRGRMLEADEDSLPS